MAAQPKVEFVWFLPSGGRIVIRPADWEELHDLLVACAVPDAWQEAFLRLEDELRELKHE